MEAEILCRSTELPLLRSWFSHVSSPELLEIVCPCSHPPLYDSWLRRHLRSPPTIDLSATIFVPPRHHLRCSPHTTRLPSPPSLPLSTTTMFCKFALLLSLLRSSPRRRRLPYTPSLPLTTPIIIGCSFHLVLVPVKLPLSAKSVRVHSLLSHHL